MAEASSSKTDPLFAISPIDGRYKRQAAALADYFSEYALIRNRLRIEVEYIIALAALELPQLKVAREPMTLVAHLTLSGLWH